MARKISAHTTEAPGSTSDLIGNVGANTRRFTAQQVLSIPITAQGDILFGDSSADTTRLAAPTSGAILQHSSASSAPAWVTVTSGGVFIGAAAGTPTFLAPPTSGAVLTFSSASSIPAWSIPTSGAILVASSIGVPTWRALGTSGQFLQSTGGSPAWVDLPADPTTGHITTAGTSGQLLQTTGGAAAWVGMSSGSILYGSTLGVVTELGPGTSGQVLKISTLGAGIPTWSADETGVGGSGTTAAWSFTLDSRFNVTTAAYVALNWNVEEIDTDAFHSTASASSLTTIAVAGTYLVGVSWPGSDITNLIDCVLQEGSTNLVGMTATTFASGQQGHLSVIRSFSSGIQLKVVVIARPAASMMTTSPSRARFWGHRL